MATLFPTESSHLEPQQELPYQDDPRGRTRTYPAPSPIPPENYTNQPASTRYQESLQPPSPRTMSPQGRCRGASYASQAAAGRLRSSDDIIIAVMGQTGAGKSSFISKIAVGDYRHAVGHGPLSKTKEVVEVDCIVDGRRVVMVDTPGFGDGNMEDGTVLKLLAEWLRCSYEAGARLSGIIFLQDIQETTRATKSTIKNLNLLNKLTGKDSMSNVVIVTSKWDILDNNSDAIARAVERERGFCETPGLWMMMLADGARVMRHSCLRQSAREIVKTIVSLVPTVLLVQKQMNDGAALIDTDVGRYVNEEYIEMQAKHKREMDELREEMKEAKEKDKETLQSHYETLMREVQASKEQQERMMAQKQAVISRRLEDTERKLARADAAAQEASRAVKEANEKAKELALESKKLREEVDEAKSQVVAVSSRSSRNGEHARSQDERLNQFAYQIATQAAARIENNRKIQKEEEEKEESQRQRQLQLQLQRQRQQQQQFQQQQQQQQQVQNMTEMMGMMSVAAAAAASFGTMAPMVSRWNCMRPGCPYVWTLNGVNAGRVWDTCCPNCGLYQRLT